MPKMIKWKSLSSTFRMRRNGKLKIIKPNEVFSAYEHEIPRSFRDVVVPLEDLPAEQPLEVVASGYQLRHKGAGRYDILDAQGKAVNEAPLSKEEAQTMIVALGNGEAPAPAAVAESEHEAPESLAPEGEGA